MSDWVYHSYLSIETNDLTRTSKYFIAYNEGTHYRIRADRDE